MENRKSRLSVEEVLYFGFFILLSVVKGLGFYEGQKIFTLFVIPAFLCVLLKIFLSPYTKRQWAMQILLLLLTAVVYWNSREIGIFFVMFMILGMKNISVKKVFHTGLWVWSLCSVALCLASFTRLEHTVYRVSAKLGLGYVFRWSLGFTHPNILHITYLTICGLILYQLADRYRFKHFCLLMLGNVVVFFYSISYTGFGIVTVLLIGGLYVTIRPRFCVLEKVAVNLILPVVLFFSFALPLMYSLSNGAGILQKLNLLVNTRIAVASRFLVPECMSPFGVTMSYLAQIQFYLPIDSSYVWLFIHYGVIPFVCFMAAYLVLIADYTKKQKNRELVLIICFLGAGLTEQLLFNTSFKNITWIFVGELLFRQKEEEKEYCLFPGVCQGMEQRFAPLLVKIQGWASYFDMFFSLAQSLWASCRRRIIAGIAAGAVIGTVICAMLWSAPKGYIVPRVNTDWVEKTYVCLESAEDPLYEEYQVMNYLDADTPMQIVEGRAVMLEAARYYVGSLLTGGLAGYLICVGTLLLTDKKAQDIGSMED